MIEPIKQKSDIPVTVEGQQERPCYVPVLHPWFGKGCPFLVAQWEDEYEEDEPELVHCKHKSNTEPDFEGNCYKANCPLLTSW